MAFLTKGRGSLTRTIFISGVQKELARERRVIRDFVRNDPLLRRYFDVFLFEDLPASDRSAEDVYLERVDRCRVYVGLFGKEYGAEDADGGLSPTEKEFERATEKGKVRLVFVKGQDDRGRYPKMLKLIRRAGAQLIRRRFDDVTDLTSALYTALVEHLAETGDLRTLPFDAAAPLGASLEDIATKKIRWFLDKAHEERDYPLTGKTPIRKALTHLNLLDGDKPNHAAILLFGKTPQRFLPSAEVKCLHFHGNEIRKPIPSYQLYKGDVFEQVDEAVDFVMSKVARRVGTRDEGPEAPVAYELPKKTVAEAIVNAVAHRDYTSRAGVQVMLFADRLEVWNPGELPPDLTPARLREPHASIPHNPLIAEPLYLAHYIEKAGTGTLDMVAQCREAGLPEPDFEERAGQFVVTLWRDWLTAEVLAGLDLNERQKKALAYIKITGQFTNREYQQITGAIARTASRDLEGLVKKGIVRMVGTTGRNAYYVFERKQDINRTNRTSF
ncbi:MAG: DUF4062 domain-containing protein [Proteobacteria bacterium]|nr:DUF4062 domain-containing protein [Pseudomonadota bacterium]MBU2262180.1 DUF4062 domain-containing protein [Pseudomonadota bacterium]